MDRTPSSSIRHRFQYRFAAALLAFVCLPAVSLAQDGDGENAGSRAADPVVFAQCLADIGERAVAEGVSAEVVARVFASTEFQARVIELDRRQPEFSSTFADYYTRRVTDRRVDQGRELRRTHGALLEQIQADTGVPPHYLLAFWGLETNFGSYFGKMAVPDSLATLACDERRSSFFTTELIAALRIIDAGDITLEGMEGSWAGAMGHMQFMPSVFLRHAVDADGDGRRDLWGSIADALTSAGHFLADMGWERGLRWGREIRLPADFDYALAGRTNRRPLAAWVDLGVTDAAGRPLPALDLPAAVLVPSGHEGPAFIIYDNFEVILGWNRSEYYAIGVGRLADRIAGAGRLSVMPPENGPRLSRDRVLALQSALFARGFDPGEPDGVFGPASRAALRAWQAAEAQIPDGYPDAEVFADLGVVLEEPPG